MRVRKFFLENEKGQQVDMNNYKESCFLSSPAGLGYSTNSQFHQLGNTFIEDNRKIEKKDPSGVMHFKSYDKCMEFINFIEKSEKLKFVYVLPFEDNDKTFYRDVSIKSFDKTEKAVRKLACPIVFNGLSLWYEENVAIYDITTQEDEIRWDFTWDSKFVDYSSRGLDFVNQGHVDAPILVSMDGQLINPKIQLYVDGELYQTVPFNITIEENEKLLYGTKEGDFYVKKQNIDGSLSSLFELSVIDFYNDNVIRLPKNKSCRLVISSDNEVLNAQITILTYFKAV